MISVWGEASEDSTRLFIVLICSTSKELNGWGVSHVVPSGGGKGAKWRLLREGGWERESQDVVCLQSGQ